MHLVPVCLHLHSKLKRLKIKVHTQTEIKGERNTYYANSVITEIRKTNADRSRNTCDISTSYRSYHAKLELSAGIANLRMYAIGET